MTNHSKLKTVLEKINWLFKSFESSNFQNISSLEKALLKEQLLIFYDEIESLKTSKQKENISKTSVEKTTVSKELKDKDSKIDYNTATENSNPAENKNKEQEVVETKEANEFKTILDTKPIEKEVFNTEVSIENKAKETANIKVNIPKEKTIIREVYKEETPKEELDKEEKFKKTEAFHKQISMPKRDMREIIDLNKSFIFKAELFNQNNDLYNQFINEMNTTQTEDDVFNVMIKWTEKQKWETDENKAYDLLLRAIEKRFLPLI